MNTLFKKYFWAIKLAGIALLALVSAGVVNDVIASKLFLLPVEGAAKATPGGPAADPVDTELGRVAARVAAANELTARRVFKLEPPVVVVDEPEEEPEPEPVKASGELEASSLPINLIGTFVSTTPEYSYANVQIEGEHKIAATGSEYLDGKARVIKIASGHIVLKEDERFTYVSMWDENKAAARSPSARPTVNPRPGRPTPRPSPTPTPPGPISRAGDRTEIAQGVTKTGAYNYNIDRKMLDAQLQDLPKLQSQARVVPHYRDNQYQGFKLVGVRPGSLYRAIGIRSGDVITAVNGNKIDSPNKALELFEQLKSSSNINVEIERRGQPKTLGYTIQ